MASKVLAKAAIPTETLLRIVREGYGPGAWHGPDLKAAIADVTPDMAYRRPGQHRHNIAEIVLHHAWVVRNVVGQQSGAMPEPFPLAGEDWFTVNGPADLEWADIVRLLESEQQKLEAAARKGSLETADTGAFDVVLGVTCHAVYHAGQIQLIKRLQRE